MSAKAPEELIARHEAFLHCEPVDRPLIGLWFGGYYPADQFPRGTAGWTEGQPLEPADVHIKGFEADYEMLYRLHREVEDDFFYIGCAYWGIPWMEAILGCPIFAGQGSAWAKPLPQGPRKIEEPSTELDKNAWFRCLLSFTEGLLELADGRFPVCPPLLRGPGDMASAVLGPVPFVMALMDDAQAAEALLRACADIRLEVLRRLNAIIPAWHGTHAAGGYPSRLWCRRTVAFNQEDCAALLNPFLLRGFLAPQDNKMARAADVNFFHLHSGCLYPVDLLLEGDTYDVIQVNIDAAGTRQPLTDLLPTFRRVQESGRPLILWGLLGPEEWAFLREKLSSAGLSLQPMVQRAAQLPALTRVLLD